LFFAKKDFKTAISYFEKSLQQALKYKYTDLIQYSYLKLSENQEQLNNSSEALKNFKKYSQYKDSLLNKETNSKVAELEVRFETDKKEKQLLQNEIEAKKKNATILVLSLVALFIGLIGFLIYRQQKLKNKQQEQEFQLKSAIAQIETQNQLQEQRLSISRDLHDNIGAQLTFVISSVDNLKHGNQITDNKITNQLTKISDFTKSTIIELRDTIWAMNSNEFSFEDLRSRIFNFIEKAKSAKENIDFKFNVDESLQDLKFSSLIGINLYRTIQESVNNAVKYADANEIIVEVKIVSNKIQIEIQDNGKGFDIENTDFGNGLHNMKKRIEEIDGTFEINSIINKGTKIRFEIPII
jgi:signal transduction histidine kinase